MAGVMGCMIAGCGKIKRNRGLCTTHYHRAWSRVSRGEATWDELVRLGECLPDATVAAKQKFYNDGSKLKARKE